MGLAARLDGAPEPVWLWDPARRRILWANPPALDFWGAASLLDLVTYAFAPDTPEARAFAVPAEEVHTTLAPPGHTVVVRLRVAAQGRARLVTLLGVEPPSGDHLRLRRAAAFDEAPIALLLADLDGRVLAANTAARGLAGRDIARLDELFAPQEADALVGQSLAHGTANLSSVTAREGEERALQAGAVRIADPVDGRACVLVAFDDVTERRNVELFLEAAARKPPEIVRERAPAADADIGEAADEALLLLDAHGRILAANRSAVAALGPALNARPLTDFLSAEFHADIADFLGGLAGPGAAAFHDGREVDLHGAAPRPHRMRLRLARVGEGRFAAALRDLVQDQEAQAALRAERDEAERKNRTKSDFIAKLSHEMRNPLNAIIGFSEIMQQHRFGPLGDRRYQGYVEDIRRSADHLLSLVNDLLDLAKVESGRMQLDFTEVALPELIEECVRLLKPQAGDLGINLRLSVPASLPPVVADARAIRQILINLISNAIKFTAKGGQVLVAAGLDDEGGVSIKVRDTGVGMSRGELQLALEPFGQVDGPIQRERKGTGLGLPLAKALTEANKALFRVYSEPQQGTVVQISFPPARVLAG